MVRLPLDLTVCSPPHFRHARSRAYRAAILGVAACCALVRGASAQAVPEIVSVWGETTQGKLITVLGRNFGTHALDIASGVGPAGWIETNAAGTSLADLEGARGWDIGQASNIPRISDERARSGRHSVLARVDFAADGNWQSVLRYRHDKSFERIYATFWVYFDPISLSPHRSTQWKSWRINHNGTVSDQAGQIYFSSRHTATGNLYDYQWVAHCSLGCEGVPYDSCYRDATPVPYYEPRFAAPGQYAFLHKGDTRPWTDAHPQVRAWNRVELFIDRGEIDTTTGSLSYSILRPGEGKVFEETITRLELWSSDTTCRNPQDPWQYFQMQNYWDDDGSHDAPLFTDERADFFYDDVYLQFGTQARVELGDSRDFESCTMLEIQEPVAWAEGFVQLRLDHGAFATGSRCFLFVVDASGNRSEGMPIVLR